MLKFYPSYLTGQFSDDSNSEHSSSVDAWIRTRSHLPWVPIKRTDVLLELRVNRMPGFQDYQNFANHGAHRTVRYSTIMVKIKLIMSLEKKKKLHDVVKKVISRSSSRRFQLQKSILLPFFFDLSLSLSLVSLLQLIDLWPAACCLWIFVHEETCLMVLDEL